MTALVIVMLFEVRVGGFGTSSDVKYNRSPLQELTTAGKVSVTKLFAYTHALY